MIRFKENYETTRIVNPISSDLGIIKLVISKFDLLYGKNLNRGFGRINFYSRLDLFLLAIS